MEPQFAEVEQAPQLSRRFRIAGYLGVFLLSYTLFLVVTFPYDLLAQGILQRVRSRIPVPFKAEKLSPGLPLGLEMEGVIIGPISADNPATISLDSLSINASLIKALGKKLDASINAKLDKGSVSGNVKASAIGLTANFKMNTMPLQPLLTILKIPMRVSGEITGNGNLQLDNIKPEQNNGKLHLTSSGLDAPNVDLKITRADFHFDNVEANFDLKGPVLIIKNLNLQGAPCGFDITGTITFNNANLSESQLNLEFVFHPTPEFESQAPFAALKKNEQGFYTGKLTGTISRPAFP